MIPIAESDLHAIPQQSFLDQVKTLFFIGLSYGSDLILALSFLIVGSLWIDTIGAHFIGYLGLGLLYTVTIARRWVNSTYSFLESSSWPLFIPCYFVFMNGLPEIFWGFNDLVIALLTLTIARAPLFFKTKSILLFWEKQKKRCLIIGLQILYSFLMAANIPSFFESLEWTLMPSFKPGLIYPSRTNQIQFYYEDFSSAQVIDSLFPQVIERLKTSPFFNENSVFKICQKNRFINPFQENDFYDDSLEGIHDPRKRYSYVYFFNQQESDRDRLECVITHELTHQMVHAYYGSWVWMIGTLPTWKNEGYAEYVANQHHFLSKNELVQLISEDSDLAERLEAPFLSQITQLDVLYQDYQAALIQVRYALDYKKTNPKDFFKKDYNLATKEEIMQWLLLPEDVENSY